MNKNCARQSTMVNLEREIELLLDLKIHQCIVNVLLIHMGNVVLFFHKKRDVMVLYL